MEKWKSEKTIKTFSIDVDPETHVAFREWDGSEHGVCEVVITYTRTAGDPEGWKLDRADLNLPEEDELGFLSMHELPTPLPEWLDRFIDAAHPIGT